MGFLDDLLTGKRPSLETRSLTTISPEQREQLNQLLEGLNRQPTAFGGEMSAPLSGLENLSLGALEERSRVLAAPDQNLDAAGRTVRGQMDIGKNTADANDFFTNAVQNPALDNFQRTVLPSISRDFSGGNFFSTERQASEGLARRDLLSSLTAERSRVNLDQFNLARERALAAAGLTPSLSDAENRRTQTQIDILDAAGIKREVEQGSLDRNYAEFIRQQEDVARREGLLAQTSLTPTIENIGMTDPGNAGLISSLLGAIAQGAGGTLGQLAGQGAGSFISRLFGRSDAATAGSATSGAAGAVGAGGAAAGAGAVGAGSAVPGAVGSGAGLPGGSVSIADMSGNVIPSIPFAGGAGLPGLVAGVQPGIAGGIAATEAANAAALGAIPAPGGVGGALGGGASADAALAGGTSAGGLAAGLGVAALPALIMAMGGFATDRNARENLAIQQSGMQSVTLSSGVRALRLPDGTFVADNDQIRQQIRERWGVVPRDEFMSWLSTLPKERGTIRRLPQVNPGNTRPM